MELFDVPFKFVHISFLTPRYIGASFCEEIKDFYVGRLRRLSGVVAFGAIAVVSIFQGVVRAEHRFMGRVGSHVLIENSPIEIKDLLPVAHLREVLLGQADINVNSYLHSWKQNQPRDFLWSVLRVGTVIRQFANDDNTTATECQQSGWTFADIEEGEKEDVVFVCPKFAGRWPFNTNPRAISLKLIRENAELEYRCDSQDSGKRSDEYIRPRIGHRRTIGWVVLAVSHAFLAGGVLLFVRDPKRCQKTCHVRKRVRNHYILGS